METGWATDHNQRFEKFRKRRNVGQGDKKITFAGQVGKAVVGYDHLGIYKDDELLSLEVCYSNRKAKIVYSKDHSYIQRIRKSFVL